MFPLFYWSFFFLRLENKTCLTYFHLTIKAGAEHRWPPIAVKLKGVIAAQKPWNKNSYNFWLNSHYLEHHIHIKTTKQFVILVQNMYDCSNQSKLVQKRCYLTSPVDGRIVYAFTGTKRLVSSNILFQIKQDQLWEITTESHIPSPFLVF